MVRRQLAAGLLVLTVFTGCGSQAVEPPDRAGAGGRTPTFRVQADDTEIAIPAWTYCLPGVCADGHPPTEPPDVGSSESMIVEVPRPGWSLAATFTVAGAGACAVEYAAALVEVSEDHWRLDPVGPADTYDVTLTARKDQDGDAHATFRWRTTSVSSATPSPSAAPSC